MPLVFLQCPWYSSSSTSAAAGWAHSKQSSERMFDFQHVLETELVQPKSLYFISVHLQKWVNAAIKVMCWKLLMKCLKRDLVTENS